MLQPRHWEGVLTAVMDPITALLITDVCLVVNPVSMATTVHCPAPSKTVWNAIGFRLHRSTVPCAEEMCMDPCVTYLVVGTVRD